MYAHTNVCMYTHVCTYIQYMYMYVHAYVPAQQPAGSWGRVPGCLGDKPGQCDPLVKGTLKEGEQRGRRGEEKNDKIGKPKNMLEGEEQYTDTCMYGFTDTYIHKLYSDREL